MKKVSVLLFIFFLNFIFCATIFSNHSGDNQNTGVIVSKTSDNLEVFTLPEGAESNLTLNVGAEFFIRIKSNLTTGYSWFLDKPLEENKIQFISKVDEEQLTDDNDKKLLGAPQYEVWKFKTLEVGDTSIFLKLIRPWEKEVEPIKKHHIKITIL